MALSLGNTGSMWGAGSGRPGDPNAVWYGQGPAPNMSKDQILADMGFMSRQGGWNPNGGGLLNPNNQMAQMLGGQMPGTNQQPQLGVPTAGGPGQMPAPAPGPAGLSGGDNTDLKNYLAWAAANPAEAQKLATSRGGMTPTGDSGFQTYNPTMTPGAPKYGLAGAEEGLQRGLAGGIAGIEAGMNQAANTLSPYTQGRGKAFDLQQALSGALGPDAQRQAFANYNQSPEMAYALEQAEKGITRNAAATGKLGSGNVLQELQRNAIGMAQQDYGNAFNRLGSLSSMGQNSANLLGGLQANAGGKVGDYGFGTGQALADYRTRAGEQIAGNVANTGTQLSGMINQQGNDLSSLIGASGNQLSQLLAGYGSADAQTKQALAALLANIASGSASQVAGVPGIPSANDPGMLKGIGDIAAGIGGLATGFGWGA